MKKTQFIELFKNIKGTLVSFISIGMFVLLGVALFLGISWSTNSIYRSTENKFAEGNMHDLEITFPYGFDNDDIEKLKEVEGVSTIEGYNSVFEMFELKNDTVVVKLCQITKTIDTPIDVEGELPSKAGEIAVEKSWAEKNGIKIGDTITFMEDDDGSSRMLSKVLDFDSKTDDLSSLTESSSSPCGMAYLTTDTYTVTALMNSVQFLNKDSATYGVSDKSLKVNCIMFTAEASFDSSAFAGYTRVLIRSDELSKLSTFSDEYSQKANELKERVEKVAAELATNKYQRIQESISSIDAAASKQLDDGDKQLQDAESQISDGEDMVANANEQLADADELIKEAEQQIADGQAQLDEKYQLLISGEAQYSSGIEQLNQKEAEASAAQAQLASAKEQLAEKKAQVESGQAELDAKKTEFNELKNAYDNAVAAFDYCSSQLDSGAFDLVECARYIINSEVIDDLLDVCIKYADDLESSEDVQAYLAQMDELLDAGEYDKAVELLSHIGERIDAFFSNTSNTINAYQAQLDEGRALISYYENTISQGEATLSYGRQQLNEAWAQAESGRAQLDSGWVLYNEGLAQLEEGKAQLEQKKAQLEENKKQFEEKKAELADAEKQLEDGKSKYMDSEKKLSEFRAKASNINEYSSVVSLRKNNPGCLMLRNVGGVFGKIRYTMALLFLIVGLLVCYSSVSRTVYDQIERIGTKKALGLRQREITLSYVLYTGISAVAGAILGVFVAVFMVEEILVNAVAKQFVLSPIVMHYSIPESLIICGIEIVLILVITLLACRNILKRSAIKLLAGPEPPKGKKRFYEGFALWKKLPLFTKTIVNNCFNDHRRVTGTLIGVAGCTALIVTAIMLNDNVLNSFNRQYNRYFHFNNVINFDASENGTQEKIALLLKEEGISSASVGFKTFGLYLNDDYMGMMYTFVADDTAEFRNMVTMQADIGENAELYKGVWMSDAYKYKHQGNLDSVDVLTSTGKQLSIAVDGYYNYNLLNAAMFMDKASYEKYTGETAEDNAFLIYCSDEEYAVLSEKLKSISESAVIFEFYNITSSNFKVFSSVSKIMVAVYVALAAVMSILVLLNLLVMFVEEKKRELIVLMINGFSLKSARKYIYSDTILLTIIGIVFGLIIGVVIGNLSIMAFEFEVSRLIHDIDLVAVLCGAFGSAALTFIMSCIALRRIKKFRLPDINN